MGAWGLKSFENDDAMDWLSEFEEQGPELVRETLDAALQDADEDGDGLEASACCEALAAAELVAACRTDDTSRLPEAASAALAKFAGAKGEIADGENVVLANDALERIKTNSELRELWAETEDFDNWVADVEALQQALS